MKKSFRYCLAILLLVTSHAAISSAETNESDWYLHLDVNGFHSSLLHKNTDAESRDGIKVIKLLFGENIYNKIDFATAYGSMKQEDGDKTLFIQGEFTDSKEQVLQRWQKLGFAKLNQAAKLTTYQANLKELVKNLYQDAKKAGLTDPDSDFEVSEIDAKDIDKLVYATFTPKNNIVFSNSEAQIEAWAKGEVNQVASDEQGLFEVVVDIQEAIMHAGINIDEQAQALNFESISAKQLSQVSLSYNESGPDSELQLGLTAETTTTANKIKAIVKGLVALKSLTVNDPMIANLLSNIRYEQNAGELRVIMSGSVDAFRALIESKG